MPVTLRDKINNLQKVRNNLLNEQARIVERNEARIIQMNASQFIQGRGSDGNALFNTIDRYKGRYTLYTQMLYPWKQAGDLYSFFLSGEFLSNMYMEVSPDLTKAFINSTGTGSGDKSIFFQGYENLFGLDQENTRILNYDIILPELMRYIKQNI